MATAFLAIGSNLGNRVDNCLKAINEISGFAGISSVSSLYETEPVGREDQADFINCVVKAETDLSPSGLLVYVQSIEHKFGRTREEKWGPRIIDLDILLYDDLIIDTEKLNIPHPMMHLRRFVLLPLSEIARDLVHPVLNVSVSKLLDDLKDTKRVVRLGEFVIKDE